MSWISTTTLRTARERLGFSREVVERLSKELGSFYVPVQAEQLRQWEDGSSEPDLEALETLAELYVCPLGHFFLQQVPEEPLSLSFRGLSSEKQQKLSPTSRQTLRRFFSLAQWTSHLLASTGTEWTVAIAPSGRSTGAIDLDEIVQRERKRFGFSPEVREQWSDSNEAFLWWRRKVEGQGVFCFQMKLEPGDIRGAATWFESYPFILVNHQDIEAAAGRLFTLLHEYVHLLTSNEGLACDFRGLRAGENPEPLANQFAARMLLSHDELGERLREIGKYGFSEDWSDNTLDEIRSPLFVSRDVVLITLEEVGLAPDGLYQQKRKRWEKSKPWGRGGGGKHPTKKELKLREIGYSLGRVLATPGSERSFALDDLSYVLDMKVEKVPEFLEWARREIQG